MALNWDLGFDPTQYRRGQGGYRADFDVEDMMKFNPAAFAAKAGGGIAGAIANYLAGGQDREDQGWGRGKLKSQYGQDVLNPFEITGAKKMAYLGKLKKFAGGANRRLGLNSGEAYGELAYDFGMEEGDDLAELMRQNALAKSDRDRFIAGQFYGAGR